VLGPKTRSLTRFAPSLRSFAHLNSNYGADILPSTLAKKAGFPNSLYLDATENRFIEEFNVANFVGIKRSDRAEGEGKGNGPGTGEGEDDRRPLGDFAGYTFVTPDSPSVLPSITVRFTGPSRTPILRTLP
jgi:branched-subunit amino acid aminotransferase/4-amino-4-deoxychorismate lyase